MTDKPKAPPLLPVDRYTRHRWHWIKGNEPECWEYLGNGTWLRCGKPMPISAEAAAAEGWSYLGEARP